MSDNKYQSHKRRETTKNSKKSRNLDGKEKESNLKYYFYKKKGHVKKDCIKMRKKKKGFKKKMISYHLCVLKPI